ncbi:MAG TPA: 2-dehydropantoate 2-reductase N-terminal domain-containing protein, partial [Acidimicrobiales bacterium]|nr:2-dehydropantoate 2-reductase N-terminal domain-containing protein [Acidimicrobiales bacterium]
IVEALDERREAMRENGVRLSGVSEIVAHPRVIAPGELDGPVGLVLLAVKCPQTGAALRLVTDLLDDDGVVVSLQNGFELYRLVDSVGLQRGVGAVVTISGYVDKPGSIVHTNVGALTLGYADGRRTTRIEAVSGLLSWVCPVEVSTELSRALWSKAAISAVWFATALVDEDVVTILSTDQYLGVLGGLAAEVARTAVLERVECFPIDGFDSRAFLPGATSPDQNKSWQDHLAFWRSISQARTGVWRDLAVHKRQTEVDCILSPIMEFAMRHNQTVPRLTRLVELVKDVEQGSRPLAWENLDELVVEHARATASGQ